MKKLFFIATLLAGSVTSAMALEENVLCTIVCSPCDEVPNTLIVGNATYEQIEKAQKDMQEKCNNSKHE